jgi:hypothetical protein
MHLKKTEAPPGLVAAKLGSCLRRVSAGTWARLRLRLKLRLRLRLRLGLRLMLKVKTRGGCRGCHRCRD